jgi:NAD(P)-dependent dehydrogenase (short-subunit alcohol dehydrogenase family)
MARLKGKTAIVTGAASGIGRGIAECFALEGARVILADINVGAAQALIDDSDVFRFNGCRAVEVDVTSNESVRHLAATVLRDHGSVDILVNNAGMSGEIGDPMDIDPFDETIANWEKVLDTNLISMTRTTRALFDHFKQRQAGSIINIASIVGHNNGRMQMKPAYNASKSGVISYTHWLAVQMAPFGVRVNSISPGIIFTQFWSHLGEQLAIKRPQEQFKDARDAFDHRREQLVPLKVEQTPRDVGWAAVFLASDEARVITGVDLPVDGGVLAC